MFDKLDKSIQYFNNNKFLLAFNFYFNKLNFFSNHSQAEHFAEILNFLY